jgi:hypothetical protein
MTTPCVLLQWTKVSLDIKLICKTGVMLGGSLDCNNYHGKSLPSTSDKILQNILLSRLSTYIDKITGDHQYGFRCNRSTIDQIFCIHQKLEEKNGITMRQYISYS